MYYLGSASRLPPAIPPAWLKSQSTELTPGLMIRIIPVQREYTWPVPATNFDMMPSIAHQNLKQIDTTLDANFIHASKQDIAKISQSIIIIIFV
jgi:hypothetical protein